MDELAARGVRVQLCRYTYRRCAGCRRLARDSRGMTLCMMTMVLPSLLTLAAASGEPGAMIGEPSVDWLLAAHSPAASSFKATLSEMSDGGELELTNGLVARSFVTKPNFATVDLRRLDTLYSGGGSFFRALSPEATVRLSHDCGRKSMMACSDGNGTDIMCEQPFCNTVQDFSIGGLEGQTHFAQRTNSSFRPTVNASSSFRFRSYTVGAISKYPPRFAWSPGEYNSRTNLPWPPAGVRLNVTFDPPTSCPNPCLLAHVVYELYDGLPVFSKWVEFSIPAGRTSTETEITSLAVEMLRVPEHIAPSPGAGTRLLVETDYMPRHTYWTNYNYPSRGKTSGPGSIWGGGYMDTHTFFNDDMYQDDAHDGALCVSKVYPDLLLNVSYPYGPGWLIKPGGAMFESFRVYELLQDSDDEERQELGRRAMLRTLAPQTTASFVYLMNSGKHPDDESFSAMIRNASAVGFDAVLSAPYNNHIPMNPTNATHVHRFKALVELGKSLPNPVMLGEYVCLQQMKTVNTTNDNQCVNPAGTPAPAPKAGVYRGADMATREHRQFRESLVEWIERTGMEILTTDCPFEGSPCAGTRQGYAQTAEHRGLADSQQAQALVNHEFYRELRSRYNTYLRVPDPYFLSSGVSSSPIGYTDGYGHVTDVWEHLNIGRMYGYDGTFYKSVTQGWMGEKCPTQPMEQALPQVDLAYAQYLGQGMPSCFNCDRVHDGEASKQLIAFWISFFKDHRSLLTTDLIHLLRPNGLDVDGALHVQPDAAAAAAGPGPAYRAIGHLFNPRATALTASATRYSLARNATTGERNLLRVPLYYTGLKPESEVEVQWVESVLADDGLSVDKERLALKGKVGPTLQLRLNDKSELMLPFPTGGLRPHSFAFFFVAPARDSLL